MLSRSVKTAVIFDIVLLGIILVSILYFGTDILSIFGGTLVLLTIVPFIYYISYFEKHLFFESRLMFFLIMFVLWINYLNYLSNMSAITIKLTSIIFCVSLALALLAIVVMIRVNIDTPEGESLDPSMTTIKNNCKFILGIYPGFALLFSFGTCMIFVQGAEKYESLKNYIKVVPSTFAWALIAIFMVLFFTKKYNINCLVRKHSSQNVLHVKTIHFVFLNLYLVLFGSIMEDGRHEWILWFESLAFLNLCLLIMSEIYKSKHSDSECIVPHNVKSLLAVKPFLIVWVSGTLILTVFIILLTLYLFSKI